jgi:hypothetical protein
VLRFESTIRLDHVHADIHDGDIAAFARTYPFSYGAEAMPVLGPFVERRSADPNGRVGRWTRTFLRADRPTNTLELLIDLTHGIKRTFKHVRRDEKGIQAPLQTLVLGSGSCRDLAMLMIDAARSLGMAARFVSGYLYLPDDDEGDRESGDGNGGNPHGRDTHGGNTHAWAQVYLPGPGWVDFDPSSGIVGNRDLVRVAVVRDPRQAIRSMAPGRGFRPTISEWGSRSRSPRPPPEQDGQMRTERRARSREHDDRTRGLSSRDKLELRPSAAVVATGAATDMSDHSHRATSRLYLSYTIFRTLFV